MNYIVFDLEATCWNYKQKAPSEIIEIGAVKINEVDGKLKVVDEFQSFVRPVESTELSDFCKNLTSITQEDVDNANIFPIVVNKFQDWIGYDYWLCSWGFYDRRQLKNDCKLHSLDYDWLQNHISLKHQFSENRGFPKNQGAGMVRALDMMGIPLEGTHHRGIDDARNIAKIFLQTFPELKFK